MCTSAPSRREHAFTLIELLVVMIIIAILMAVAVPTFMKQKRMAVRTQIAQNLHTLEQVIETCAATGSTGGTSYKGCVQEPDLWASNKELSGLQIWNGQPLGYDVDGVDGAGNRLWGATPDMVLMGYEVYTFVEDNDSGFVFFQTVHWPDGDITRRCGPGKSPSWSKAPTGGVPGSKLCPTGKF